MVGSKSLVRTVACSFCLILWLSSESHPIIIAFLSWIGLEHNEGFAPSFRNFALVNADVKVEPAPLELWRDKV